MNKVAVIGSNGYIGSALIAHLESKRFEFFKFSKNNDIFVNENLNSKLLEADDIIWCASHVNPISAELQNNLVHLELYEWKKFLQAFSKQFCSAQRIIFLSSGGCSYTSRIQPYTEKDEALGTNHYGKLKIEMENELKARGLPHVILRLSNLYGPNQPTGRGQGVIAEWLASIKIRNPIKIYGDLTNYRDYIHLNDVCSGIESILSKTDINGIFNLGSGEAITLKQILDLISENTDEVVKMKMYNSRTSDRPGYFLNITKLTKATGWKPIISIQTGISLLFSRKSL